MLERKSRLPTSPTRMVFVCVITQNINSSPSNYACADFSKPWTHSRDTQGGVCTGVHKQTRWPCISSFSPLRIPSYIEEDSYREEYPEVEWKPVHLLVGQTHRFRSKFAAVILQKAIYYYAEDKFEVKEDKYTKVLKGFQVFFKAGLLALNCKKQFPSGEC